MVISRRVLPGEEPAFEEWLRRMRHALDHAPGYLGSSFTPPNLHHPEEWVVLYRFDTPENLDGWLNSPQRLELVEESGAFLRDEPVQQRFVEPRQDAVTLVVSVQLRPGEEPAYRRLYDAGVADARRLGGLVRAELVPAVPGAQEETVSLLTFATQADLDRWLSSSERARVVEAIERLAVGERSVNVVGGFAGWFPGAVEGGPRWKQAVVVVAGLLPVAFLVGKLRDLVLPDLPSPISMVLTTVVNVMLLTWVVMPVLTRRLAGWLQR